MATKKGATSGPKRQFKEKIVQIYETLFKGDVLSSSNAQFWDEFFLLKPKTAYIDNEIQKMSQEQLFLAKTNISLLVTNCIEALSDSSNIRVVYALQTLCAIIHSIFRKASEVEQDVFCIGFENSEDKVRRLLEACEEFLIGDSPHILKCLSLKLLLILATRTESINQNTLVEHVMNTSLFECLLKLLCHTQTRQVHGYDVVLLLTLLVNYRKYDAANPYVVKLSILDDELALNGYGQVITSSLCEFCNQFNRELVENQHSSWLSSLTTMVGNIFISEEGVLRTQQMRANNAYLLALYEAIHLNRNFITTLAHTQIDGSSPPSPINTLSAGMSPTDVLPTANTQPSNLLVIFFQYCSIVMQDTKSEAGLNTVKLCFLILCCITEDQYANSLMHDVGLAFKVCLHKLPMRHRKVATDQTTSSQPLVCSLLDLLVEFFLSHLMKKFPIELYVLCISVLQRILCYQKRCRIRLNYVWKNLWTALLLVLRFLLANESSLVKKMNIIDLLMKIVNIFNFFITYGDTFLPTPGSYDELYYELIRMHQIFDNIYSLGLRYSTSEGEYKDNALKLNNSLINVRAIIKHFSPKIDQWLLSANLSTPSEQQILDVVKKNYDSLTLKLQDSLDQYDRYSEKPEHVTFFNHLIKTIVMDTCRNITFTLGNLQKNEFIITTNEIK